MKQLVSFFMLLLLSSIALAENVRVTCTPATKFEDGTTIPSTATTTFSLFGALEGQTRQKLVSNSAICDFVRQNVSVGTQTYHVTQTTNSIESVASIVVSKVIAATPPPTPQAPTAVMVSTQTAYEFRPATQVMAAIGLVPEGVSCGPEEMLWKSVMYCRVKLADSLPVVWPANRSLREVWAVKPAG